MRWKLIAVVLLLAAIAPVMFTHVAQVVVDSAVSAVDELVSGGSRG